ncbi:MAG TPA: protein-glutamate O-methyltransferase CheR [Novosphingobium sp.]|nr:protein-glutamate O-methyltransferase CheR [Novosphingobium sp.]
MSLARALDLPGGMPGISPDIYGKADFTAVAAIVHAEAGIVLPSGKAMLVYSRLAPLVRETASGTFALYLDKVRADPAECARMIAALTTNHTFFYREAHHFEHLAREVRPGLLRRLEQRQPVRIWSAGCSSGEETWSLVMTLLGPDRAEGRRIAARDLRVLASDIAPKPVERASQASYPARDLEPVPAALRDAWTQATGENRIVGEDARAVVRFRLLNLLGEWPMRGPFQAIFCRNVMIYFDNPTKERLVARFAAMLEPGGHLYIGHSERVTGPAASLLQPVGPTIYRRQGT